MAIFIKLSIVVPGVGGCLADGSKYMDDRVGIVLEHARSYHSRGWCPTPLHLGTKRPELDNFTNVILTSEELHEFFARNVNIGVVLGAVSGGLVDVDLDTEEAVKLAPLFLPETARFGRPHSRGSHRLYVTTDMGLHPFSCPGVGMVVEIRGSGGQTVFPGSLYAGEKDGKHKGEPIQWEHDVPPVLMDRIDLISRVGKLAAAAVLLRCWGSGNRDHLATAVCGTALRIGWSAEDIDDFVESIAIKAGDEEARDRAKAWRMEGKLEGDKGRVPGAKKLAEIIGKDKADRVVEWMSLGHKTKTLGEVPAIVTITADVLWGKSFPPTKWVVPAILPAGVALLAGKPKAGKSWIALDMALAVAGGAMALGALQCEPGPVLYVAAEDTKKRLAKRLRILCPGGPPPLQLDISTDILKLGQGGEEQIRAWLDTHPTARLIIIDTLAKIRAAPKRTDTAYSADYEVGDALTAISGHYDVTLLVVAHVRKAKADDAGDTVSGTLGLTAGVDGLLVLQREARSNDAVLSVSGRDVDDPGDHNLVWDHEHARWTMTSGDPRVAHLGPEQKRVYELLVGTPRNVKELTEGLNPGHVVIDPKTDSRRNSCSKLVHKLHDKGLIKPRPDGKWESMVIPKNAEEII